MKSFLFCLTFALAFGVSWAGGDDPTAGLSGIEDLTVDNFDKLVNGGKHALIEFYAPWCGHCKRMTPEFKKLGELIKADPKLAGRVVVGKVNADDHRSLGEKFDVKGYPTIKFLPRGKAVNKDNAEDYNAARTADKFLEYLKEKVEADRSFARVDVLDAIASKFSEAKDKAALVKEAVEAVASNLKGEAKANGDLYVKFMQKALEKGGDYLAKEKARLDKILASGSVHSSKIVEMSKKASVLGAFSKEE